MLPLSQTAGYAVLALSCLDDPGGVPALVQDIAARTGIPRAYLSKLMNSLAHKGLILAKRGHKGGVILTQPAREITLDVIAEAVDGDGWRHDCLLGFNTCSDERACPTHTFWKEERERIHAHLQQNTLADIARFERNARTWRLMDSLLPDSVSP
ncbi:MAG TPA: Rrf2 family transcriptional regulator [Holophagaceae bacterium]